MRFTGYTVHGAGHMEALLHTECGGGPLWYLLLATPGSTALWAVLLHMGAVGALFSYKVPSAIWLRHARWWRTFMVFLSGHATGAGWLHFLMLDCLHWDLPITYMMKSVLLVYHHINGLQGQVWGFGHCGAVQAREPAVHRRRAPERAPGAVLVSDSGEKAPRGHGSSLKGIDCSERDRRDSERL